MRRLNNLCLGLFFSFFCLVPSLSVWASSPVVCQGSTEYHISIYRSALPSSFTKHIIVFIPSVDGNGDNIPITDNQATFKYDGTAVQVMCDGSARDFIPNTSYTEIHNKITCTIENEGRAVRASFILYDQDVYSSSYSIRPSDNSFPELAGTNETSPYCYTEDDDLACKWQQQNVSNGILSQRNIPLNNWVVYGKTNANNLIFSNDVETTDSTYSVTDYVCANDTNGNGNVDIGEMDTCVQIEQAYFCPVDAVECMATYGDPICPDGSVLNTGTDRCEAAPNVSCSTGYIYISEIDTCAMDATCPDGGGLNPTSDLCEIVVTSDLCPAGYTYNSTLGSCTKAVICPANGTYSSDRDQCELPPDHSCPDGYSYNSGRNICEVGPTCSQGTYNASTNRCELEASGVCPSGYTYDSGIGLCKVSATCPSGSTLNTSRDKCEAAIGYNCPTGYAYNSSLSVCQSTPTCPTGSSYNTLRNQCELDNTWSCPSGMSLTGSICYRSATCTNGSLNTTRDKCEVAYTPGCGSGYTYNSSRAKCEASPICPSGTSYSTTYNVCLIAVSSTTCPSGYTYNSSHQKCEKAPTCPSGSLYNASTDRCEMAEQWYCSVNGGTYSSQSACNSVCTQTGTCTSGTINGAVHYWIYPCANCGMFSSTCRQVGCSNRNGFTPCNTGFLMWNFGPPPPAAAVLAAVLTYSCESAGNSGWTELGYVYGWYDQVTVYTCSLTGSSYSSLSTCNSNCSQGVACSSTCPSGYTKSGSLCIANATCTSGGTLNTSVDKCQYAPTYNCASGYTYDSAIGYCKVNATCASSGTLDTSVDKCQLPYSHACPSGYSYNSTYNVCQKTPVCSQGTYNTSTNRCELGASVVCPSGYTYDTGTGLCKVGVICGSGGSFNGSTDKCEVSYTPTCASGFTYNSTYGVCQKAPSCLTGGSYNTSRNQCEVDNTWYCPSGMSLTGSICYLSVYCPSGGSLNPDTELCESASTLTCFTEGYNYSSTYNKCVSAPICDYGYFDASIDLCRLSASGICPGTYTYNNDQNKCFSNPPCLSGAVYSTTLNQCSRGAIHDCADGTLYSDLSRLCEAYPMCEVGTYMADTNSCYEGDNTCPYGPQYVCLSYQGKNQCSALECVQYGGAGEDQGTEEGSDDKHDDGETDEDGACIGTVYIFNGHDRRCRSDGVTIGFQDCCVDEDYFFGLGQCKEEEKQLAHLKARGMCHYIGEYCSRKIDLGFDEICIEHSKTYCCFSSKLGRVIQEQGRPQLKAFEGWGQAEGPYCRGMTPDEFQMVDFSRVDLSEWYGDIVTKSQAEIGANMQNKVQNFYDNVK